MEIIGLWLIGTILVAIMGNGRKIGVIGALFASLLLSPIIGLIITLSSKRLDDVARETESAANARKQTEALEAIKHGGVADQLQKLQQLRDSGSISEDEYQVAKAKVLG